MLKCPYCFEDIAALTPNNQCPKCQLFVADKLINLDYPSVDKKKCYFCGCKIVKEARYCRYCRKWVDDVEDGMRLYDDLMKDE